MSKKDLLSQCREALGDATLTNLDLLNLIVGKGGDGYFYRNLFSGKCGEYGGLFFRSERYFR